MLFRFLSTTTTYLKATEKGGIKITKDTFIVESNDRTFLIVNKKNTLINLKWQPTLSGNKSRRWKKIFCNTLAVLGESGPPAETKGDNHLPVLALHSKLNEELKRWGSLAESRKRAAFSAGALQAVGCQIKTDHSRPVPPCPWPVSALAILENIEHVPTS